MEPDPVNYYVTPDLRFVNGTKLGTKLLKCVEGQYNKAFIMTMDTGHECVARIPNPNAGPIFYLTASEVATRHFVRNITL